MQRSDWNGQEEATIVLAASIGNLSAFDELARRYRNALISVANQILGSRDLAEDAAQEALLIAYASLPSLAEQNRFGSWLATILRHRAFRIAKGERRTVTPLDEIVLSYVPAISAQIVRDERDVALWEAVRELPDEIRPVVELYYREDWSVRQIASFLDLPETTVKWRLHAARRQLRTCLSPLFEEIYERELA